MKTAIVLIASCLLAAVTAGCVAESEDVAQDTQELSIYRIKLYFSDPELTQIVGERSNLCTSTKNWGERTPYVYAESGDCIAPSQNYPAWGNPCTCCWDYNNNGGCDFNEQGSLHACTATFDCR